MADIELTIPSANPTNFHQAISDTAAMPRQDIWAKLFLPDGPGPFPVVIVVPGSLGLQPHHLAHASAIADAGIAACGLDPFGPRSVTSTVANQVQYSFAASAWDVLATAEVLAARPDIDAARIGAQGHSRGGSAVLSAASVHLAAASGARSSPACMRPIPGRDTSSSIRRSAAPVCGRSSAIRTTGALRCRSKPISTPCG